KTTRRNCKEWSNMAYYKSLREFLEALDKAGKLVTINSPINKDTQLAPLSWLQERGLPDKQHKAFLFTNVFDSRGRKYDIPVAYGALRMSAAITLQCRPEETNEKVSRAVMAPIAPRLVKHGPVQDVVYRGDRLLEKGGLDEFPIPITHPGWDAGPIMSASCWVTKDPDTGARNVGVYRCHVYAQDRFGIHMAGDSRDITAHWQKCRAKGIPLQAAVFVGGPPNLTNVATSGLPYDLDEFAVAGALAGEPVELVKCKTVDLEVPAHADIVFEGELTTEELVLEGPHGEAGAGEHASSGDMQPYLTVKCITHRKDPIWVGPAGHIPGLLLHQLKHDHNAPNVLEVANLPSIALGSGLVTVIKMKLHTAQEEVWRALEAFDFPFENSQFRKSKAKYVIAVDDDVDIRDANKLLWALCHRVQPHRDCRTVKFRTGDMKPSSFMPEAEMEKVRHRQFDPRVELPVGSRLLINATLKWPFPPVSLPRQEFMEEALRIWQKEGLPPLQLKEPWYGYELGHWPRQLAEDAARAAKGEYYQIAEMRAKNAVKIDYPPMVYPPELGR
ncbi:MAG: UbiD family decarboxylase, partial [Chloroflexota bacterium]